MDGPDRQPFWRFLAAVALTYLVSLALFQLLLEPPRGDLILMAEIFLLGGALSLAAVLLVYRMPLLRRSTRVGGSLLGLFTFVAGLTFLNVWLAARLMFISRHDFLVTTVILVFAVGVAVAVGYLFSSRLVRDLGQLERVAQQLARGNLTERVQSERRDELGRLALSFDRMAEWLEEAEDRQRELERVRRDLLLWTGHDLRTPLASVRVIVEALADGVVEDEEAVQRYLATARRDLVLLSRLVEDIFLLAQLDSGRLPLELRPAALEDVVSDTLESFRVLAERKGVRLEGTLARRLPLLNLDVPRVGRALNNLVDNALRHTPTGGLVEVRVDTLKSSVRVVVEDSGEGIEPAEASYVFQGVRRAGREGMGLGLPLARAIIEAHGGHIWLERLEPGTRFVFSLPVEEPHDGHNGTRTGDTQDETPTRPEAERRVGRGPGIVPPPLGEKRSAGGRGERLEGI